MARQQQIRTIVGGLNKVSARIVSALALEIHAGLVEKTPVDTGWARANWIPSVGTSPANRPAPKSSSPNLGATLSRQSAGIGAALSYKLPEGAIFITNNVPYINDLNNGTSSQAPAGFVESSIDAAISRVRSSRRNL